MDLMFKGLIKLKASVLRDPFLDNVGEANRHNTSEFVSELANRMKELSSKAIVIIWNL